MNKNDYFSKDTVDKLYSDEDRNLMVRANEALQPGKSRVEEIRAFARKSGIKRVGIAYCVAVQKEAEKLGDMLSGEFEVSSVSCKVGRIPRSEFLGEGLMGLSCNPAGQADELAERSTELNITFGLCMGHDILFNSKSKAPVTALVVKDRKYRHNPFEHFSEVPHYEGDMNAEADEMQEGRSSSGNDIFQTGRDSGQ